MSSSRAKRWVFTINNWEEEDQVRLRALTPDQAEYVVWGRERGEQGTPHLQGFVVWKAAIRFTTAKNRLGGQCHLEIARGDDTAASTYCKKEEDFEEYGQITTKQGRRSDLKQFFEEADAFASEHHRPMATPDVARTHPTILTKYRHITTVCRLRFEPEKLRHGELRDWQQQLDDELEDEPHPREVKFIVDHDGNSGKSWYCGWCLENKPACQVLTVAKNADILHAIRVDSKILLFDVPRGSLEYLSQNILEKLKDGIFFAPKYTSMTKRMLKIPHVVVFTNEIPLKTMTNDRYNIKII